MMLSKLTFISLLTEGINTVVPFYEEEIETCYEVIQDYLSDNFSTLAASLGDDEFEGEIYPAIIIVNHTTGENAFTLSFNGARIYLLKDGDLLDAEVAGSIYGVLTLLCTFLVARLNSFTFSSKEVDPFTSDLSIDTGGFTTKDDNGVPYDDEESDANHDEDEEESSFDDEWL